MAEHHGLPGHRRSGRSRRWSPRAWSSRGRGGAPSSPRPARAAGGRRPVLADRSRSGPAGPGHAASTRYWRYRRRARSRCPAATWTPRCSRSPRSARRSPGPADARRAWHRCPSRGSSRSCAPGSPARPAAALAAHDVVICLGRADPRWATTASARARRAGRHRARRVAHLSSARSPPPAPPGCGRSPCPPTPTASAPTCLAAALEHTGARIFYCSPPSPTRHGATLSPTRRQEVMAAVRRRPARSSSRTTRPVTWPSTARRRRRWPPPTPTATSSTCGPSPSRAAPGLRVAALAARGPAGARLRAARVVDDFFVSGPLQHAALDLVSSAPRRAHRRRLRAGLTSAGTPCRPR